MLLSACTCTTLPSFTVVHCPKLGPIDYEMEQDPRNPVPVRISEDTAKTVAKAPKKVANAVSDATAHKVNVTMTEYHFTMPATAKAGKTTFVIKNAGRKEHAFEIKGQGIDQKLSPNPKPGQTATLQVDLKPGSYNITCPLPFHTMRGMKSTLMVK